MLKGYSSLSVVDIPLLHHDDYHVAVFYAVARDFVHVLCLKCPVSLVCMPVWGLREFEALEVVKDFADKFLAPHSAEVARSVNRYVPHRPGDFSGY